MSGTYGWILSLWQLCMFVLSIAIVAAMFWPKRQSWGDYRSTLMSPA